MRFDVLTTANIKNMLGCDVSSQVHRYHCFRETFIFKVEKACQTLVSF